MVNSKTNLESSLPLLLSTCVALDKLLGLFDLPDFFL